MAGAPLGGVAGVPAAVNDPMDMVGFQQPWGGSCFIQGPVVST